MATYLVKNSTGVHQLDEEVVQAWLRSSNLTGVELARREDDESWRPLHELPIFREAVPHVGDPRDAARRRVAQGLGWHMLFYAVIAGGLLGITALPSLIWGAFVLIHAIKALPTTVALAREGKLLPSAAAAKALPAAPASTDTKALPEPTGAAAALLAGSEARTEASSETGSEADAILADVRSMLARRPGGEASAAERLDGVAESLRELRERIERLSALLATQDRATLAQALDAARVALDQATDPEDQTLRRREVEVLRESLAGSERAHRALERLQLRERLAMQGLRQLRLDLARVEADADGIEDVGERLEQIRIETEAAAEADALVAVRS